MYTSCFLLADDVRNTTVRNQQVRFVGTGDPVACLRHIDRIIHKVPSPDLCAPKPCAIGGVYQPLFSEQLPFFALSKVFKYVLRTLHVNPDNTGRFCIQDMANAALQFCTMVRSPSISVSA